MQINDALRLGLEMRLLRARRFALQQSKQGERAQSESAVLEKVAAIERRAKAEGGFHASAFRNGFVEIEERAGDSKPGGIFAVGFLFVRKELLEDRQFYRLRRSRNCDAK